MVDECDELAMDQTEQVYETEVTGWKHGLYEDIGRTTGFVGSIWRTIMYHEPEFLRYMWGQLKPLFQTREFAAFEMAWRDTLVSSIEPDLPGYGPDEVGLSPSEYRELQAQLARYDWAIPRYVVTFETMDRLLAGREVGTESPGEAALSPYPDWMERRPGREPTKLPNDEARERLRDIFPPDHVGGLEGMIPSGYRSWARWPSYLERAWTDLSPIVRSEAFESTRGSARDLLDTYVDRIPYTPAVDPETLTAKGWDENTVEELHDLFATFNEGAFAFVTLVPIYAATTGVLGERHALTFP